LVVAVAAGHVAAAATVRLLNLIAVSLSLLRPGGAREIARLVPFCLVHVRTARATDLHAVRGARLSRRDEVVHQVYRLQTAKATRVLRLLLALP
jgi:hypothetical protein